MMRVSDSPDIALLHRAWEAITRGDREVARGRGWAVELRGSRNDHRGDAGQSRQGPARTHRGDRPGRAAGDGRVPSRSVLAGWRTGGPRVRVHGRVGRASS